MSKNTLKMIWAKIVIFFKAIFRGMKSADEIISGTMQDGASKGIKINETVSEDSVYDDLLQEKMTQEVLEMRDSTYRVERHSNDYKYLGNGFAQKKEEKPDDVIDNKGYRIIVSQPNKMITRNVLDSINGIVESNDWGDDTFTITVERSCIPKFKLETYCNKVTIKQDIQSGQYFIDMYFSEYPRQFMPTDGLFVGELHRMHNGETIMYNNEIVEIDSLSFITDKCDGDYNDKFYKVGELEYQYINKSDGNFIMTFKCNMICNSVDLIEKFRTKEMDKKYEEKAPKNKVTECDISTYFNKQQDEIDEDKANELIKEFRIKK